MSAWSGSSEKYVTRWMGSTSRCMRRAVDIMGSFLSTRGREYGRFTLATNGPAPIRHRLELLLRSVSRIEPSAELLGQRDDDSLGAAEVAEPVAVLVLHHLADEFGAVGPQPGDSGVEVVDG